MDIKAWAAAAIFGLALHFSAAHAAPLEPETVQAIDAAMAEPIDSGWTAGGAVAVMRRGEIVFQRGYGMANLETETPVTPATVFRIGSLTKQFTAAAILLLAQDGKLSLDDRVGKHLPQFPTDDPTTIRQLLSHTSGIIDYVGREPDFMKETRLPHTPHELVAYVLQASPLHRFPSGSAHLYSSSNYALAGAIVERLSGQTLGSFLKVRIFVPLGMKDTALDDARDVVPGRASGYDRLKADAAGYANARPVDMSVPYAAGAMRSTVRDLLVWSDALIHDRLLSADSHREMTTPARLADGSLPLLTRRNGSTRPASYGLGVEISGKPEAQVIKHGGAIDGFTSDLKIYVGQDVAVVALVNTSPSPHLPFARIDQAIGRELGTTP